MHRRDGKFAENPYLLSGFDEYMDLYWEVMYNMGRRQIAAFKQLRLSAPHDPRWQIDLDLDTQALPPAVLTQCWTTDGWCASARGRGDGN